MNRTVVLDIETIPDQAAMLRADYRQTDEYAPWPLHELVCASYLVVEGTHPDKLSFRIGSASRDDHGERGIVATVERELEVANELITYNGEAHDLPILLARGVLAEVAMPAIRGFATRTSLARHADLLRELRSHGAPACTLKQLCAPLRIPVKPDRQARVADLAARGDRDAIKAYCESDTVATWLAARMWRSTTDPAYGQECWRTLARWIVAEQPRLAHLLPFAAPPAWPLAGGILGDAGSIVF